MPGHRLLTPFSLDLTGSSGTMQAFHERHLDRSCGGAWICCSDPGLGLRLPSVVHGSATPAIHRQPHDIPSRFARHADPCGSEAHERDRTVAFGSEA